MAGRQFFSFVVKSVVLGIFVAGLMLFLVPNLRNGEGFTLPWLGEQSGIAMRKTYRDAISRSAPAVVNIYSVSIENDVGVYRSRPRERTSLGSGVIMTESGYILTCNHVVQNADSIVVAVQDGQILEAQIVGTDQYTDLAVLKVKGENLHQYRARICKISLTIYNFTLSQFLAKSAQPLFFSRRYDDQGHLGMSRHDTHTGTAL